MPPLNQRAPEMRLPKRIEEVKVAEAEVLSVVAPAGPTVAVALALQTAHPLDKILTVIKFCVVLK